MSRSYWKISKSLGRHGLFLMAVLLLVGSCSGNSDANSTSEQPNKSGNQSSSNTTKTTKISYISKPGRDEIFHVGDPVEVQMALMDGVVSIDSFQVFVDGQYLGVSGTDNLIFSWKSSQSPVGKRIIKTITYGIEGQKETNTVSVIMKSDIVPEQYGYKIIHQFPHDISAYTQGLVYEDGFLYESTGQRGESSLRKVYLESGKLIKGLNLPPNLFGEGTCIFKDKIIQLTWTSKIGFVYDKATFRLERRIEYPTQGWGLTTDGEQLIMSDGSHIIYFLEPEYFSELSRIEVFDNEKAIVSLNELEYIDGNIYANVYQTDFIVVIDPLTGKVLSRIDMSGLLKPEDKHDEIDVLNGIAYDAENKRLLVTGKRWPLVYEIQLEKK